MTRTTGGRQPSGPRAAGGASRRTRLSGARRRRLFRAGSVGFIVGLLTWGVFATDVLGGARPGQPAPDISFNTAYGEFRLAQQKGKVVVLYFSFPG